MNNPKRKVYPGIDAKWTVYDLMNHRVNYVVWAKSVGPDSMSEVSKLGKIPAFKRFAKKLNYA